MGVNCSHLNIFSVLECDFERTKSTISTIAKILSRGIAVVGAPRARAGRERRGREREERKGEGRRGKRGEGRRRKREEGS